MGVFLALGFLLCVGVFLVGIDVWVLGIGKGGLDGEGEGGGGSGGVGNLLGGASAVGVGEFLISYPYLSMVLLACFDLDLDFVWPAVRNESPEQ